MRCLKFLIETSTFDTKLYLSFFYNVPLLALYFLTFYLNYSCFLFNVCFPPTRQPRSARPFSVHTKAAPLAASTTPEGFRAR